VGADLIARLEGAAAPAEWVAPLQRAASTASLSSLAGVGVLLLSKVRFNIISVH
jgi:hypothetical protein